MRTLRDRDGREWQVWHVVPDPNGYVDRRRGERRRFADPAYVGEERRTGPDRRSGGSILDGWLCFQCGSEKRRLLSVPPGWERLPEERLQLMLRLSVPVAARA